MHHLKIWIGTALALVAGLLGLGAFYLASPQALAPLEVAATPAACVVDPEASRQVLRDCSRQGLTAGPGVTALGRRLYIDLQNPGSTTLTRQLHLGVPDALALQAYVSLDSPQGPVTHPLLTLDADSPFGARPRTLPALVLPLDIPPGGLSLSFSYQLHGDGVLHPVLYTDAALQTQTTWMGLVNGTILGIMLTLLATSLIYSVMARRRAYGVYAVLVLSEVLLLLQIEGYAFALLWPDAPRWNTMAPGLFATLAVLSHALFALQFFEVSGRFPRLYRVTVGLMVAIVLNLALLGQFVFDLVLVGLAVVYCGVALLTGGLAVHQRLPGAPLYLLGAGVLVLFACILFSLGILGHNPFPALSFFDFPKFGLLFESLCFSAALVNQIRQVQEQQAELRLRRLAETQELLASEDAKRAATALAREKSLQLASASHDISQPLASLRFAAEALRGHGAHEPIAQHLDNTLSYAQGLLRSLIQQTRDELQPGQAAVDLGALLARVATDYQAQAQDKGLRLRWVHSQVQLDASELVVSRILHNLVGNALRYTPRGRVLMGVRRRAGGVELQVLDTGPGLLPNQIQRLQQPYEQGAQAREGHGLGLFIVKSLCEQSGYHFRVRSQLQHGSCFSVFIPHEET